MLGFYIPKSSDDIEQMAMRNECPYCKSKNIRYEGQKKMAVFWCMNCRQKFKIDITKIVCTLS